MKLKPCPFCGGKAKWNDTGNSCFPYQIICESCYCGTDINHRKDILLARWNRREPIDDIVQRLEEESYNSGKLYGYFKDHNTYEVGGYQDGISKAIEVVKGAKE